MNVCVHCGASINRINTGEWVDLKGSGRCPSGHPHGIQDDC